MTAAASVDIAEELGIRPASPGVRSLAFVIDLLVWLLLASPAAVGLWLFLHHGLGRWQIVLLAGGSVLVSAFCVVQIALHGRRGVTLGKAAMKLRSVSMPGLSRPGFWRIVLRSLVLSVSNVIPIAGPVLLFSSSYWDSSGRRRSMLDKGRLLLADRCVRRHRPDRYKRAAPRASQLRVAVSRYLRASSTVLVSLCTLGSFDHRCCAGAMGNSKWAYGSWHGAHWRDCCKLGVRF